MEYFGELIAVRRQRPEGDLLSDLIVAEEQGDRLRFPFRLEILDVVDLLLGHRSSIAARTFPEYPLEREAKGCL
jgi:cytochrome P450